MTIFERIKELADKQGKSLQKVSEDLGLSQNYIYNLKGAKSPAADKLALIADYFNVTVDYLMGRPSLSKQEQPKNRIREFRLKRNLTLSELVKKTNDWLQEEFEDHGYTTSDNTPLRINSQKLVSYENYKTSPEGWLIWQALADSLNVDIDYLEGISDVEPLETKFRIVDNVEDYKKELSENALMFNDITTAWLKKISKERKKVFAKSQFRVKTYIGNDKTERIKNNYSITSRDTGTIFYQKYFALLEALNALESEFLDADYQILLAFAQLDPQYQAKALEQVKNLLIVQEATKNHNKD